MLEISNRRIKVAINISGIIFHRASFYLNFKVFFELMKLFRKRINYIHSVHGGSIN